MVVPTYTRLLIDPEMGLTFIRERKAFKLAEAPNRNSFTRSLDIVHVQQDAICSFVATLTCYLFTWTRNRKPGSAPYTRSFHRNPGSRTKAWYDMLSNSSSDA